MGVFICFAVEILATAATSSSSSGEHGHSHGRKGSAIDEKQGKSKRKQTAEGYHLRPDDAVDHEDDAVEAAADARRRRRIEAGIALVADGLHNAMDGVVIAGAFLRSPAIGWRTVLVVVLHELPHELGDFAALTNAGLSWSQVVVSQIGTGLASCVAAAVFGIAGDVVLGESAKQKVSAVTTGAFLYLSLASFLPEVRAGGSSRRGGGAVRPLLEAVGVLLSFAAGLAMLAAVDTVEELVGVHAH